MNSYSFKRTFSRSWVKSLLLITVIFVTFSFVKIYQGFDKYTFFNIQDFSDGIFLRSFTLGLTNNLIAVNGHGDIFTDLSEGVEKKLAMRCFDKKNNTIRFFSSESGTTGELNTKLLSRLFTNLSGESLSISDSGSPLSYVSFLEVKRITLDTYEYSVFVVSDSLYGLRGEFLVAKFVNDQRVSYRHKKLIRMPSEFVLSHLKEEPDVMFAQLEAYALDLL